MLHRDVSSLTLSRTRQAWIEFHRERKKNGRSRFLAKYLPKTCQNVNLSLFFYNRNPPPELTSRGLRGSGTRRKRGWWKSSSEILDKQNSHVRTSGLFADKEVARWRRKNVEGEHLRAQKSRGEQRKRKKRWKRGRGREKQEGKKRNAREHDRGEEGESRGGSGGKTGRNGRREKNEGRSHPSVRRSTACEISTRVHALTHQPLWCTLVGSRDAHRDAQATGVQEATSAVCTRVYIRTDF